MRPTFTSLRLPVPALAALLALATPALAQPDPGPGIPPAFGMRSRLMAERPSAVQPGIYTAGENLTFTLAPTGARYLLRFAGAGETFVLNIERGSLGAKLLKYDTGTTAVRVSVWGGMTVYTRDAPQGMPATWQRASAPLTPLEISANELNTALNDEARHLTYVQNIALKFSADPAVLAADGETRGRAFDAMTNAATGIERYLAGNPAMRSVLTKRINSVRVAEGGKPTITLSGQTLLVSFVPDEGHEGHASSLAIQQELTRLFAGTAKDIAIK